MKRCSAFLREGELRVEENVVALSAKGAHHGALDLKDDRDKLMLPFSLHPPADATPVSLKCKTEIRAFRIEMYKDIDMDKKMGEWLDTSCWDFLALYEGY